MLPSPEFRKQLAGYGLTTAEILYRMPDHPAILQSYIWQEYDLFPEFPVLKKFLDFWERTLEGVGCSRLFGLVVGFRRAAGVLPPRRPIRHGVSSLRDTPGRH